MRAQCFPVGCSLGRSPVQQAEVSWQALQGGVRRPRRALGLGKPWRPGGVYSRPSVPGHQPPSCTRRSVSAPTPNFSAAKDGSTERGALSVPSEVPSELSLPCRGSESA
ncbi:hypothetical protein HPB47_011584 [Ixodes persulcatus]|uniref:Uncharacterized protein n=1 Tax=Ixodes persulcatus TaxID=34615 RepID=A0AC60NW77_IXOPE|nr:hypothetical protein HPB47_011584 [Ixodes persulcatus]